jgi:hypothetical protein
MSHSVHLKEEDLETALLAGMSAVPKQTKKTRVRRLPHSEGFRANEPAHFFIGHPISIQDVQLRSPG